MADSVDWAGIADALRFAGPALANHLWQSTLFALAAAALALALRRNHARARYWIWMAASLKFLLPFALLTAMGSHLAKPRPVLAPAQPTMAYAVEDFNEPFVEQPGPIPAPVASKARPGAPELLPLAAAVLWISGFLVALLLWGMRWRRVARAMHVAARVDGGREMEALQRIERAAGLRTRIELRISQSAMEPGVFGMMRPVLAWPALISARLDDEQLDAVLAHEVCHVRRRDNLTAALHMFVEAAFWFHPLVWWLGARLLAERERACDEEVLLVCARPQAYAESILKVCEFCVESPVVCVSGVTGADLKRRVVQIMTERGSRRLTLAKKLLLAGVGACAVAAPIVIGLNSPLAAQAADEGWEKAAGGKQQFEVASVRENKSGGPSNSNFTLDGNGNTYWVMDKDTRTAPEGNLFRATNTPLMRFITFAYKLSGTQELPLRLQFWAGLRMDVPAWLNETHYDIEARAPGSATKDQMRLMMQSLLAERFKLAVHWETRPAPVFAMTLDKPGVLGPQLRAHPASDTCATTVYPEAAGAGVDRGGATTIVTPRTATSESQAGAGQILPIPCGMIARLPASAPGRHRIGGRNVTLAMLADSLPAQTGLATFPKPVIDRTGLSGMFDFTLEWTPPSPIEGGEMAPGPNAQGDQPGPSIAQAIKEQLGIKLESSRDPVKLLVIDHVEKPSEN